MTGGALFPTVGRWNSTLITCGFVQDLEGKLYAECSHGRDLLDRLNYLIRE